MKIDMKMSPYGDTDLVKIGWVNGLLPSSTKPLPEPMLTSHSLAFIAEEILQWVHQVLFCIENYTLKILPHLSAVNELKLVEAGWRIYASVTWAIIDSCHESLSFDRRLAIICTNAKIMLSGP